ncbi:hypothetical protein [Streptococcus equi]|uniref:hypothetical protein n=1 Tax=Streptococcus equi TaxID=1336 RepID=UPI0022AB892C|nr:hypothetical protein [Streptococcus equi]
MALQEILSLFRAGFGSAQGQLHFGDSKADIVSWDDTLIQFKIPAVAAGTMILR